MGNIDHVHFNVKRATVSPQKYGISVVSSEWPPVQGCVPRQMVFSWLNPMPQLHHIADDIRILWSLGNLS